MKKNLKEKILLVIIAFIFVFCERALFSILGGVGGSWKEGPYLERNELLFDIVSLYIPLVLSILYVLISNHSSSKKVAVLAIAMFILFGFIDFADRELTNYCQNNNNNKLCEIVYTRKNDIYDNKENENNNRSHNVR